MAINSIKIRYTFGLLSLFGLLVGCKTNTDREEGIYSLPPGYSMGELKAVRLSEELAEISGIAWTQNKLLAIEDESSVIFELDPSSGKILKKEKFEKNRDVEDILVNDSEAWILRSNGNLYRVSHFFTDSSATTIFEFPVKESRDLEAFVLSQDKSSILLFCKVCEWDENPDRSSVFRFSLETLSYEDKPVLSVEKSQLKSILPKKWKKVKMQPSAAAFHPITGELYLLSATDKWLMVLDQQWNPVSFHFLDPKYFWQAEGMTFDPSGNLFISNEESIKSANWLYFPYTP